MSAVRIATPPDEAPAIDVLVRAFSADPAVRWVWPEQQQYSKYFPGFVKAWGGGAFARGSAYYVGSFSGAALWLPPGVHPDEEALTSILQRSVSEQMQKAVFGVFEQMGRYHPSEPHWYLALMGIDPPQQGKGLGSALITQVLSICDRDHMLAYLESSNQKNIPFYQKHGFELLGTIQAENSPSIFPMLRKPRADKKGKD